MMTRTEYNETKEKILANTDTEQRERGLNLLEIASDEDESWFLSRHAREHYEKLHLKGGKSIAQMMKEHNSEIKTELMKYKSIVWAFDKKGEHGFYLLISDPNKNFVFVYIFGDIEDPLYKLLSDNMKYCLQDWKQYDMPKPTGIFLDKPHKVFTKDIIDWNVGHLSTRDFSNIEDKLNVLKITIEATTYVNIFDRIDDMVESIYKHYKAE